MVGVARLPRLSGGKLGSMRFQLWSREWMWLGVVWVCSILARPAGLWQVVREVWGGRWYPLLMEWLAIVPSAKSAGWLGLLVFLLLVVLVVQCDCGYLGVCGGWGYPV